MKVRLSQLLLLICIIVVGAAPVVAVAKTAGNSASARERAFAEAKQREKQTHSAIPEVARQRKASTPGHATSPLPVASSQSMPEREGSSANVAAAPGTRFGGPLSPLVSGGAMQLAASQQQQRTTSPEVVVRSRTRWAGLDATRAAQVDREAFPAQVERPAGGLASLPAGHRLVRMISAHAAQVELANGNGKRVRAAVESVAPLAVESSPGSGHLAPVELALEKVDGVFESERPIVGVLLPQHAEEGVTVPEAGVSLTPVDASGAPLGGAEGQVDGASLLYANTQTDEDTLIKPTTAGFAIDAILRSSDSPRQLYYRVGLPAGAKLVEGRAGTPVRMVSGGITVGLLTPPTAVDAAGASIPVTMSVLDGNTLSVNVQQVAGEVLPVSVDPEYLTAEDRSLTGAVWPMEPYKGGDCEGWEAKNCATNWKPVYSASFSEAHTYKAGYSCGIEDYWCDQWWEIQPNNAYNGGEVAGLEYKTQGESTVYNLEMWVEGYNEPSETDTEVEYNYGPNAEGRDNHVLLSGGAKQAEYKYEPLSMTSGYFHNPLETPRNNDVRLMDYTTKHESLYGFWTYIWGARVYVAQEESKHPEAEPTTACPQCGFNTTSSTIAGAGNRTNILYGSGGWLGPLSGAFEVTAHDPGIGISFAALSGGGIAEERFIRNEEGKCLGIQCSETYSSPVTYLPTMDEGEDSMELFAEDAAGLYGYSYRTIKVDAKPPEKLEVTGWNARREISAASHTLTVSATDEGPSGKKSSGVKSIAVSIDGGQETTVAGATCSEGPCTARGTYTLHAEDLSEGVHRLVVMATDNAGNVAPGKEYTFDVRYGSPVAVGPGSVDPTTGQFTLNASDVSLGGVAGVARTYQSRDLTAGSDGPFGPQWALNLGASQNLVTLPDGEVALTAVNGGRTTFAPKGKGEYESPLGDENIKLDAKEKEPGKGVTEYLVQDAKAGTTTVFTQPTGTEETAPIYANQFGAEAVKMGEPAGVATDAAGNVWVTDFSDDRVLEFSSAGVLLHAYGSEGEWLGNFKDPWGIAVNKSTGNVYVSDIGNNRVVELNSSGGYVRAFGWAVKSGTEKKEEFQDCTSYCQAGTAGAGAGQFDSPRGIAIDSSGNVWVAEYNNDRVQEFTEKGEYLHSYGSAGTGGGQFEGAYGIAFSGGDLYVTDGNNARLQEISTSGAFIEAIGWGVSNGEEKLQVCTSGCRAGIAGSGNGEFKDPSDLAVDAAGNLYVSDMFNSRVQEITASGAFVTKFGTAGSGNGQFDSPISVAVGPANEIYVADYGNQRVQEWMRPVWLPARTEDALKHVSTAYAYKKVTEEGNAVIEPTEVLAATPAGITCVGEHDEVELQYLKDGCRALSFNYAEATTAKGEAPSAWGDYTGHLTRVYFHGYDSSSKAMRTSTVAHYLYDQQGRLRAEWDPRTEPEPESEKCAGEPLAKGCLATTYGYDEEGHVTAVTPPHQAGWTLIYGTSSRDAATGRLLKVTRPAASAKLWAGEALVNTAAPKLSGTPVVGVRMAVSEGKWTGEPVSYAYQWQDCNAGGGECVAIAGATNANYTPTSSDAGHALVAKVMATNASGSVTIQSGASAAVASSWQELEASETQGVDEAKSINAVACVPNSTDCVISDWEGNAYYATNVSATSPATWTRWSGGGTGNQSSRALTCPTSSLCMMADEAGYYGDVYYARSLGGKWEQETGTSDPPHAMSCVSESICLVGQRSGDFADSTSPTEPARWPTEQQGTATITGASCLSKSFCAMVDSAGVVHVATSEAEVKSSSWTQSSVDGSTAMNGIACLSTSSCVAVDAAGNVLSLAIAGNGVATTAKQNIDGATALTAVTCTTFSVCVAVDAQGHVFVSTNAGGSWKQQYSPGGDLTSVSCASSSLCVTANTVGDVTSFDPTLSQPLDEASGLNAISCVPNSTDCVVSDGKGNAYYATNVSATGAATWHAWSGPGVGPSEAVDCPTSGLCLLAAGEKSGFGGNLYYASSLGGAWTQAYSPSYGVDAISCVSVSFCVDGQDGYGYFRYSASPASGSWELEQQGEAAMKDVSCVSKSFCAIVDSAGKVHVATTEAEVKSSSWTQSSIDGTTALNGISCMSTSSCVAVDAVGDVLNVAVEASGAATATKQDIDGTTALTAIACASGGVCVTVDGVGDVFTSANAGKTWSREYQLGHDLTSVSCASASLCAVTDTAGRVTAFDPEAGKPGAGPSYIQPVEAASSVNAVSCIPASTDCVISDSNGNAFYATNVSTSTKPNWTAWSGPGVSPSEALDCPGTSLCLMAAGKDLGNGGNLYYASSLGGAWTEAYGPSYGVDAISCASLLFCVDGQDGYGYFRYSTNPASGSWELKELGTSEATAMKSASCLSASFCVIADSAGRVHVATSESQVKSSSWTETDVDGSTALNGIACISTSSCVAVDSQGNVLNLTIASNGTVTAAKQDINGTNSLNAIACSGSTCAAVGVSSGVFTSTDAGEDWKKPYLVSEDLTSVSCASPSDCVTVSQEGAVTVFNAAGAASEAAQRSPQPGITIEYNVPRSGEGAPEQLGKTEVEKWAQKDDPTEGTAIFPADEPQGWPASGYKKATVDYIDEEGRTVNTLAPGGGVSTTEYNEANDVTRTLSPDNRAAALAQGSKSAEVAEHLSSISEYNAEDSQVIRTLGPEHKIRLANGEEAQARAVTHDYYDEGSKEVEEKNEEEYNLLTKSVTGALLSNGSEQEKRTTITSYSGQNDLGWKLRKPTSTTVDPEGLDLTTTTVYNENTGESVETRAPAGAGSEYTHTAEYLSEWGSSDAEAHVNAATDVAAASEGHVWVADTGDSRVLELGAKGEVLRKFGSEGSGDGQFNLPYALAVAPGGDVWVADTSNNRIQEFSSEGNFIRAVGSQGSEDGQFKSPQGIAVDSEGHVWVADTGNSRLQEFNANGEFMRAVGSRGEGNGQFYGLMGLAVDGEGNVWVADAFNNRVQEFSSTGTYVSQFHVRVPMDVAVASNGDLVVSSTFGALITEFSRSGQELASINGEKQLEAGVGVAVDSSGDVWVAEAGTNGGVSKYSPSTALGYLSSFGKEGTGEGQFKTPTGLAVDQEGDVWVADTGNDRIQELSATGTMIRQFGSEGEAEGQFKSPTGTAIDKEGDIWVADTGNKRLQKFSSTGVHMTQFKTSSAPSGIAVDTEGHLWVTEETANEVSEYSSSGQLLEHFGGEGTATGKFKTPTGIALDKEGHVWVADEGNNRIQEFSATGEYLSQVAVEKPRGLRFDASGDLWVAHASGVQELSTTGQTLQSFGTEGTGNGQFKAPWGLAVESDGHVWVADSGNDRVQQLGSVPVYSPAREISAPSPMQFADPKGIASDASGDVWVADTQNNRIQEVGSNGKFIAQFNRSDRPDGIAVDHTGNIWTTIASTDEVTKMSAKGGSEGNYGSAGTGNGQFKEPAGIATSGEDEYVVDHGNDRVQELNSNGEYVRQFGEPGSGHGQLSEPQGIAIDSHGDVWVADTGNNRLEEFSSTGAYIAAYGTAGTGNGQFNKPEGLAFDNEGDIWVADTGNSRVQELSPNGGYLQQFATEGTGTEHLNHPAAVAIDPANHVYVLDSGNSRVQEWQSLSALHEKAGHSIQAIQTIYYTAGKEASIEACQNHPEWASLPCRVQPATQPTDVKQGKPSLPVSTMTYNIWDEIETTTEEFGSVTRTKTETYDAAGRAITSQETSTSTDKSLPTTTNEYNLETGALEKQSATINGSLKTISMKDNALGQLVEYQDGTGNTARYRYEEGGDNRLLEVSEGKGEEAESKQTYSYDETTGLMTKLIDSAAGTFTASYDPEGKMTSEIYPNGMCANTSYNATGVAIQISYIKTRNCSEEHPTVWFSDSLVPGIYGETLAQQSTLATERYAYDDAGRLTETQEEPTGKGCTTRLYAYDEASNRLSMTTRQPGGEGKCATEGGTIQRHTYDEANRLTDEGIEYEPLGNTTKLPASDAGGKEITSSFYIDGQTATQEQNGIHDSYTYDPAGRTMETTSENIATKAIATTMSHYAGANGAVTWASQGEGKWSRNIPGIGGGLQATEESTKVVTLQLTDLQGNIVATASEYESETKLLSTYNSTEFGEPNEGKTPPKYAWLGDGGLATETAFGTGISTQAGASYVPQVARSLQTAPVVPPGAFPNGIGGGETYTATISAGDLASAEATATQIYLEAEAARHAAKLREMEEDYEIVEGADPYKVVEVNEEQAIAAITAIDSVQGASYLDLFSDITSILKIDFIKQAEDAIFKFFTKQNKKDVEKWFYNIASGLEACVGDMWIGYMRPKNPHCWIGFHTTENHIRYPEEEVAEVFAGKKEEIAFELPVFADSATVEYCPHGEHYCYG